MTCYRSSLEGLDLKVVGILRDIFRSRGDACFRIQCDPSLCCEQEKCSCFIRGIIRNTNGISVCDLIQGSLLACIDAERLIVDLAGVDQFGSLLLVERIQIIDMLEIVRIQFTGINNIVRNNVVFKYLNVQVIPLLFQQRLGKFQDLRMRCRGSSDADGLKFICESAHRQRT